VAFEASLSFPRWSTKVTGAMSTKAPLRQTARLSSRLPETLCTYSHVYKVLLLRKTSHFVRRRTPLYFPVVSTGAFRKTHFGRPITIQYRNLMASLSTPKVLLRLSFCVAKEVFALARSVSPCTARRATSRSQCGHVHLRQQSFRSHTERRYA